MKIAKAFQTFTCLLLLFNFFYDGIYKFNDMPWFKLWLTSLPHINKYIPFFSHAIPISEMALCTLLAIPMIRLQALYISFWYLLIYQAYLVWAFSWNIVLIPPYHIYWLHPTWFQVVIYNIILISISFFAIISIEIKTQISLTQQIAKI